MFSYIPPAFSFYQDILNLICSGGILCGEWCGCDGSRRYGCHSLQHEDDRRDRYKWQAIVAREEPPVEKDVSEALQWSGVSRGIY